MLMWVYEVYQLRNAECELDYKIMALTYFPN
jgi:hypothetical protein